MKTFRINTPDENIRPALIDKINDLTKPKGALGRLEELALLPASFLPSTCPDYIIFLFMAFKFLMCSTIRLI